jgi:hypothetical protein
MRATRWIAALALLALGLPPAVLADELSDGDVQEQLQIMQQRLKRMEDQLREAERRAPPPAEAKEPSFWDQIVFNGWVAGSWFYNFEDPDGRDLGGFNSGVVTAYPFHPDANSFSLDQLWLGMEKPVSSTTASSPRTASAAPTRTSTSTRPTSSTWPTSGRGSPSSSGSSRR